jgi:predicted molibdopterin-dependent oxidoreductase YjgC
MSNDSLWFRPPPRPSHPPAPPARPEPENVEIKIDGQVVRVPASATILEACRAAGIDTPTLCYLENLTPVNVCRICVVELAQARTLVPACSRRVEPGMDIRTDSPRVKLSRKMVIEFLASSVDLSTAPQAQVYAARYGACPERYGAPAAPAGPAKRDSREAGHHHLPEEAGAETVAQPVKVDNDLYVRDYGKCILCYKCVEACGTDAQNTFAIAVAGRGFDARISTEANVPLPDSACVYCGNCIGVCPTGALMFRSEYEMRRRNEWDESRQTRTDTICPYCGVGCTLSLHVQDNRIVKVTSPMDVEVTHGHLCIKGRFGFEFVHGGELEADRNSDSGATDLKAHNGPAAQAPPWTIEPAPFDVARLPERPVGAGPTAELGRGDSPGQRPG